MRTLKLSHREIELITTALGIAEKTYLEQHNVSVNISNVRGGGDLPIKSNLLDTSLFFRTLNEEIIDGRKDY